jgi:hypothetical protein
MEFDIYSNILNKIVDNLKKNNSFIVEELKTYLITELFVKYDDRIKNFYEIINRFAHISSQKAASEKGQHAVKEGADIEKQIYTYLNGDNKYDNILFTSVIGNFDKSAKNIKGEFDLVIGDFDDKENDYNIKKIYDIKRSANLITDDNEKFTNAVNILNANNIKLLINKDKPHYNKSQFATPIEYKGYIYINDLSNNDLSWQIVFNIIKFIQENKKNIDRLLKIIELFKFEEDSKRPVMYLGDINLNYRDLYDYIKTKYDEENTKLKQISPNFTIYKCNPYK